MRIKKHLNLRLLFYAVSACFTVITMFHPISCGKKKETASQQSVEILRMEQQRLKQSVQVRLQVLDKRNDSLQHQLRTVNTLLNNQKGAHLIRRSTIKRLIQSSANDSFDLCCDSIRDQVQQYIQSDQQQDSLYEENIQALETIIVVKDSTIGFLELALETSQSLTDKSLSSQAAVEGELLQNQRQVNRKQIIIRVLSAGVVFLAGTTATLLITR